MTGLRDEEKLGRDLGSDGSGLRFAFERANHLDGLERKEPSPEGEPTRGKVWREGEDTGMSIFWVCCCGW